MEKKEYAREDSIAEESGLCYQCDNSIAVGSDITTIGPIRMHRCCVEDYFDSLAYEEAMAEHRKNPITYSMEDVKKLLEEE